MSNDFDSDCRLWDYLNVSLGDINLIFGCIFVLTVFVLLLFHFGTYFSSSFASRNIKYLEVWKSLIY